MTTSLELMARIGSESTVSVGWPQSYVLPFRRNSLPGVFNGVPLYLHAQYVASLCFLLAKDNPNIQFENYEEGLRIRFPYHHTTKKTDKTQFDMMRDTQELVERFPVQYGILHQNITTQTGETLDFKRVAMRFDDKHVVDFSVDVFGMRPFESSISRCVIHARRICNDIPELSWEPYEPKTNVEWLKVEDISAVVSHNINIMTPYIDRFEISEMP